MIDKIQSMSKDAEKVSERIHTVEFNNQNLLKYYEKLGGRICLHEGNLHTTQIISKNKELPFIP